jgi:putative DNA primase/helicase
MIPTPTPEQMLVRGWSVFPVRADKRPAIVSWKPFQRTRPSVAQVREWARKLKPKAWAVVTGKPSDIITLDFDGDTGNTTLRKLGLNPHVRTGSGGYHLYISYPGFKVPTLTGKTKQEMGSHYPGLDIRGDGGYAIFSGVNHNGAYEWLRQPDPDPFESLPADLQAFIKRLSQPVPANLSKQTIPKANGRVPAERLISQALQEARTGGRNNIGFWLAAQLRDNGYLENDAKQIMSEYSARVSGRNAKGQSERYTEAEALASVRQAYSRAPREPWTQTNTNLPKNGTHSIKTSHRFDLQDSGVFYLDSDPNKEPLRICSRLEVLKETRDETGEGWGRLLKWRDREGRDHLWSMPMSCLAGNGEDYRARLLSGGLEIEPGKKARDLLTTYIQTAVCNSRARCVSKLGWHADVFVLPDGAIGASAEHEEYIYQSPYEVENYFRVRGSLEDWRREIGLLCAGNSRLTLAVCLAFASPLLLLSETESGGFHLWGPSSLGKTTALTVAGSVCGGGGRNGYVESWRTTTNALEAFAELHNDSLACLDEISQVSADEAVEALYMLANGQGKGRMTKTIGTRRRLSWTILLLSSGELTLREHAETAGKRTKAGGEIRLVNIPADAGAGMGLFEDLHGFPSAAAFSGHLKEVSKIYYGAPIREFLKYVTQNRTGVHQMTRSFIAGFLDDKKLRGCAPEVSRVARRFALTAGAGEIATEIGLTGWPKDEATRCTDRCLNAWIRARGSTGPRDIDAAINQVAAFIEKHGASRFQAETEATEKVINRAGFLAWDREGKIKYFYILPEVFRREVCTGYDAETVAKALLDRGFLEAEKGRLQKKPRIAGHGSPRVYAIKPTILSPESEDTGDDGDGGTHLANTKGIL